MIGIEIPYKFNFKNKLEMQPHIGIIADGMRRWSKIHKKTYKESCDIAGIKLIRLCDLFCRNGFEVISLYFSSIYNFNRNESEIRAFCSSQMNFCLETLPKFCKKYECTVKVVGEKHFLNKEFKKVIAFIEKETKKYKKRKLYLCVAYDPFLELNHAISRSSECKNYYKYLYVKEPLNLLIRTAGANLLSNYLPLQSAYARFYVIRKLFNNTNLEDFEKVIEVYRKIHKKYGE